MPADWTALAAALLDRELARSLAAEDVPVAVLPRMTSSRLRRHAGSEDDLLSAAEAVVLAATTALTEALTDDHPLAVIAAMAELEPIDAQVLAVCAAIDMDRSLQRLVGVLRADPTATRIDIDLLGRLLGVEAQVALGSDGRLARAALLDIDPNEAFASTTVIVPRRVIWALLGDDALDPKLPIGAELIEASELVIGGPTLVLVSGDDRVRRVQAAAAALGGLNFLLCAMPASEVEWRVLVRQATVGGQAVLLECATPPDALTRRWIERASHLAFALCTANPLPMECVPRRTFTEVRAADPEVTGAEWMAEFPGSALPSRRPTAQQLQFAAQAARPGEDPADVMRRVASGSLLRHARRVYPAVGWDDLVLPGEQKQQLQSLVDRYRDRAVVHGQWRLPLYPSPGVVALFAGPSGTGKSTAAEVIAGALGLDMFRIDLSALVSKYIGETEKNLEEIFAAAHSGDYVLLFDEADALFGSRSKVSDAKDRYANMEVSYLLQRLESYDGFVILTSNFQGNIDPAFLRRIHVAISFAVPSEADREQIWRRSLAGAPQQDLDLADVAQRFDLTGGSIRMAALSAAYLAASRRVPIGMTELMEAINGEMTKLRRRTTGKPLSTGRFNSVNA